MSLTKNKINRAEGKSKPYKLFDRDGLHIIINPSGSKVWRFKYQFQGREQLITLGKYPEIDLNDARRKAFDTRRSIANGIDPSTEKREQKQFAIYKANNTFEAIAVEWHDTTKPKWCPRHAQRMLNRMKNHLFPVIGKRPIDTITPLDILHLLKRIEAQGKIETVHRLLNYTQCVFRYAVITGRILNNPARELGAAIRPKQVTHFPSIPLSELAAFLKCLSSVNTSRQNKLAVMLQLLTFLRTNELRQTKWSYINFETKEWRVPASLMKMKLDHIVPLSGYTISILKELKNLTGDSEYILPNSQKKRHPYMSENTINYVIELAGYKGKLVGHGFRSMASTALNERGFNRDAIERQLAHKEPNAVRAAYNYAEYMPERVQMMEWWGNLISDLNQLKAKNVA